MGQFKVAATVGEVANASIATIDIKTAGTPVAPQTAYVNAEDITGFNVTEAKGNAYDPTHHDLNWEWTLVMVGGPALENASVWDNVVFPDEWKDRNKAYTKEASFLLPDPGNYRLDLRVTDSAGNLAVESSSTIVVANPDLLYSGARTVALDPDGLFVGAPSGAQQVTSLAAAMAILNGGGTTKRLSIAAGVEISGQLDLSSANNRLAHVDRFGTGLAPVSRPDIANSIMVDFGNSSPATQFNVDGISFQGPWDAATETGVYCAMWDTRQTTTECFYSVANCIFEGFSNYGSSTSREVASQFVTANSYISRWSSYAVFLNDTTSNGSAWGLCDVRIEQDLDALNGGPNAGKFGLRNEHGCLRGPEQRHMAVNRVKLLTRNGWSALGDITADNAAWRMNSGNANANSYGRYSGDRVLTEGGGLGSIVIEPQSSNTNSVNVNAYLNRVITVATAKNYACFGISIGHGGVTIQNWLAVLPDVPRVHTNAGIAALYYNQDSGGTRDDPVQIRSVTALSLLSGANIGNNVTAIFSRSKGGEAVTMNATERNVVFYAPNQGDATQAPLDLSAVNGVVPQYKGTRNGFELPQGTLGAAVANGSSFTLSYPAGTDQAYWQALPSSDDSHGIWIGGVGNLSGDGTWYADRGDMTIAFEASVVRVTNTSGVTWENGRSWAVRLDRSSQLPAMDTSFASPATIPRGAPTSGSPAFGSATGSTPVRDIFFNAHNAPANRGAWAA